MKGSVNNYQSASINVEFFIAINLLFLKSQAFFN